MRLRLLLHAARTARPRQIRARSLRPLTRRRFPVSPPPTFEPLTGAVGLWRSDAFEPVELAGQGSERLRAFHEQYGEDVLGHARRDDAVSVRAQVEAWIDRHPPGLRDSWHPYPLSTRIGNWLAAFGLVPEAVSRQIEESLWRQLLYLEGNVEDDILGNHVIRNARALILGGAAFGTARLLDRGFALLQRELPEQVLSDGGHYERSPVYHLIVLRDLLEIEALLPGSVPSGVLERMRQFATALTRPDGAPALFNDGSLDLAPRLDLPPPEEGLSVFPETGYVVLRRGRLWLAFDCGPPSPPYLPAHAHADALSLQVWIDGRPMIVDPGMSTYEAGSERDWFRGTRAHSTVAIDGRDQFQLWGAFRSGRLPKVELTDAGSAELSARVSYRGIVHARRIVVGESEVVVTDVVEGSGRRLVESFLPLGVAADVEVTTLAGGSSRTEPRAVSERFYLPEPSAAHVQNIVSNLPVRLGWRVRFPATATIPP